MSDFVSSFTPNFAAELVAAFIIGGIAFLLRGSIGHFLRRSIQPKPDLDLFFQNRGKIIEVRPSTPAGDYDVSFTLSARNTGAIPLSKGDGSVHFFVPKSSALTIFDGKEMLVGESEEYHRLRLNIDDLVMAGFTDLAGSGVRFRITKPASEEIKIPYYIQTRYGDFPETVRVAGLRESTYVPAGSGVLAIRLLHD